jgi:hypothetical protein
VLDCLNAALVVGRVYLHAWKATIHCFHTIHAHTDFRFGIVDKDLKTLSDNLKTLSDKMDKMMRHIYIGLGAVACVLALVGCSGRLPTGNDTPSTTLRLWLMTTLLRPTQPASQQP